MPSDRVVTKGRAERIHIAVAVDVRRKYAMGPIGRRADRVTREILTAVVLVPGDRVVIQRRAEYIRVAVVVHVRRKHTHRTDRLGADRVARKILTAVVFVPGDRAVVDRRAEHVDVAVPVQVGRKHVVGPIGCFTDRDLAGEDSAASGKTADRHLIILDLTIARQASDSQTARGAQAKPRVRCSRQSKARNIEHQGIVADRDIARCKDLFARSTPAAIAVEVNPSVQLATRALYVHR